MSMLVGRSRIYQYAVNLQDQNSPISIEFGYIKKDHPAVLDVGCACGDVGRAMSAAKPMTLIGVEINSEAARMAEESGVFSRVYCLDVDELGCDSPLIAENRVDYVLCSDVLEHLRNPGRSLELLAKTLKEDGRLVASIPNVAHMSLRASLDQHDFFYTDVGLLDSTHVHLFAHRSIARMFARVGFQIEDCHWTFAPENGWQPELPFQHVAIDRQHALANDWHAYVCQYVVCAKLSSLTEDELVRANVEMLDVNDGNAPKMMSDYRLKLISTLPPEPQARKIEELEEAWECLESEKSQLIDEKKFYINKSCSLEQKVQQLGEKIRRLEARVTRYELAEDAVLRYARSFTANNSASLINAAKHVRQQVLSGGLQGKKDFLKWFNAVRKRANHPDARFNPFWDIYETARKTFEVSRRPDEPEPVAQAAGNGSVVPPRMPSYCKFDVLFFSVIDYSFRYQRPQQIADYYARNGHRVFYFNVNFGVGEKVSVKLTYENLYEVTLNFKEPRSVYTFTFADVKKELESQLNAVLREYAILDAIAISEYPNWVEAIEHVKHTYTLTDVLDYLDDWDGFENTATPELVANTRKILGLSDCVIASSQYLADKAAGHGKNVVLVRNGTEFSHFNKVFSSTGKNPEKKRTVGYYGAIAHWFDVGKIKALAEALPDVEIELIGAVSTDVSSLQSFRNVKFLGEKSYQDLPELIRDWDVCLIPFDTSTSLIKATNPVKFYEYLSAGKKVVATEIPEISDFAGKYALLANDDARFVAHVKSCLVGKDGLASSAACACFAHDNDWQCRLEAIDAAVVKSVPRFSIVVLTYGQLEYTKLCLASILKWTAYPNYELIVVDNASTDGTPAYLKELSAKYPQMRVILNEKNLGFAAGNNMGLRAATGDYLLLLNNDTMVSRGWLSRFLAHFRAHPECGAVGPVSNSIGNKAMVAVRYEDVYGFLEESKNRSFDHAFEFLPEDRCLAMFCYAFPRSVMDRVGLISEEYGRGMFEDDDYCMAIRKMGFCMSILDDVLIHHFLSVSFDAWGDEEKLALHKKNREFFEGKWKTNWVLHKKRPGIDWPTNAKTTAAFGRIVEQGRKIFESSRDETAAFGDRDFNLCDFIDLRKKADKYEGVYVLPSVWWEVPIFQRSQQMALAFASRNYLVIYLEMPSEKYAAGTVRSPMKGVYVFTVSSFEKALDGLTGCIVSIYSTAFEICTSETAFPSLEFVESNKLVYEFIDHFDDKISGKMTKGLVDFYNKITASGLPIHFLASARNLQRDLEKKIGKSVMYVPNGVDEAHYSKENIAAITGRVKLPKCLTGSRPKIGYFGALAPWLDYKMLNDVIVAHPEWDFIFIGPDYSGGMKRLPAHAANCHLLGPIPYADLPAYAARFDVAMLPFQRGELARSTSPLKLFEYFALGKPVVVTPDMDECMPFKGVLVGDGVAGVGEAISKAIVMKDDAGFNRQMLKQANGNTWVARVAAICDGLGLGGDIGV